ncbi:MAG: MBL fold metallo-hydrolase [Candidatus Omnitrophica bacterium]|nr:MBL fold metallo-hydrolase [Candidatus Omnitrophota bacterium]
MKLKILAEGSTKEERSVKHWGLSILIGDDMLFDTFGKPDYVLEQLKRSGIDPDKIKHIAISHDDWDHITGLWKILERNNGATVYICPNFSPDVKEGIKKYGARFVEVDKPTGIKDGIYASGELRGGSRGGIALPEQYLAVKTPKGVVVITGCAHPGIVEIVRHAKKNFGPEVRLLIGGFHLKDNPEDVNAGIVASIKKLGVRQVIPLHCTGSAAQELFAGEYGRDCIVMKEGQTVEI